MGAVPWTKNRMVIVYLRKHAGREYVRLRTFNRHQVKGVWYPAPRFYMVPIASAKQLGELQLDFDGSRAALKAHRRLNRPYRRFLVLGQGKPEHLPFIVKDR